MAAHLRTVNSGASSRALKQTPAGVLQRKCACGTRTPAGGECEACGKKKLNLQRRAVDRRGEPDEIPSIVHEVLRSSGQPLDAPTRASMEPRLRHDFSDVRVHTDARAADSARAVNALAYTVGRDVVFGAGQYVPWTSAGRSLMAHELTHVTQQRRIGESAAPLAIGRADANEEHEARSAESFVNSRGEHRDSSLLNGPRVLRRQPAGTTGGVTPGGTAQPAAAGCVQDATDKQADLRTGTVTVIDYGATWCVPCGPTKQALEEVCNSLSKTMTAVPVRFFSVDLTDDPNNPDKNKKTRPAPWSGSLPAISIYIGTVLVTTVTGGKTVADISTLAQKAISCASQPGSTDCQQLTPGKQLTPESPAVCTIVSAVSKGKRFKFAMASTDFLPGEKARLEALAKQLKAGPTATVSILGLASLEGDPAFNKTLSCRRASVAAAIFRAEGLTIAPINATGGMEGTANDPEFRAVDIKVIPAAAPLAQMPTPMPPGQAPTPAETQTPAPQAAVPCKDPPTPPCVFKPMITGPIEMWDARFEPKAKDPKDRETTNNCTPALYTIETTADTTANTAIKSVRWRKLPPAGDTTRSVERNANDNVGDAPSGMTADGTIKPKRPSFASLNPTKKPLDPKSGCPITGEKPVWCVPFCSFGEFQMEAWITWVCDPDCLKRTDVSHTGPLKINVKELK